MRLVEKNMSWAPFLACPWLDQGLTTKWRLKQTSHGPMVFQRGTEEHFASVPASSHTPFTVKNKPCYKSSSLRRQECAQRSSNEGQRASTAPSWRRTKRFILPLLSSINSDQKQQRPSLSSINILTYAALRIRTKGNAELVMHVWPKSPNPTYNMWLFHSLGMGQNL